MHVFNEFIGFSDSLSFPLQKEDTFACLVDSTISPLCVFDLFSSFSDSILALPKGVKLVCLTAFGWPSCFFDPVISPAPAADFVASLPGSSPGSSPDRPSDRDSVCCFSGSAFPTSTTDCVSNSISPLHNPACSLSTCIAPLRGIDSLPCFFELIISPLTTAVVSASSLAPCPPPPPTKDISTREALSPTLTTGKGISLIKILATSISKFSYSSTIWSSLFRLSFAFFLVSPDAGGQDDERFLVCDDNSCCLAICVVFVIGFSL